MNRMTIVTLLLLAGCGESPLKPGDKLNIMSSPSNKSAPFWGLFKTPEIEAKVKQARLSDDSKLLMEIYDEHGTTDIEGSHPAIFRSETPTHMQIETTVGTTHPTVWIGYVNKTDVIITREKD